MGRPRGSKNIPWASIVARLREHPGRWMLLREMSAVHGRTIAVIRKREHRELRLDDGIIRCRTKAAIVTDEKVTVTLYLKFDPKEKPDAHQATVPAAE